MPTAEPQIVRQAHGSARSFTPLETFPERRRAILTAAMERVEANLAQAFRGITTDGTVRSGLFPRARTGVSSRPILDAANAFAATLEPAQRNVLSFPLDSANWRAWQNMHTFLVRHGVCLDALDAAQREAALALLRATLSAAGFAAARDVMKLNEHVAELSGRTEEYGEWYYFLSFFGTPSEADPWGWQLDGHHLNINCFVVGDQLVLTPFFSGSEPLVAASGKYAGTRSFDAEEATGLELMRALSLPQRADATIGTAVPRDVLATAQTDNLVLPYAGIAAAGLDAKQQALLEQLVGVYVGRIRAGHAEMRMDEVRRHLDETYFGWIGGYDDSAPFYYRVHSPVILIEFDHLPGLVYDNLEPTRRHVHTVVRTPNGNDYGRDLLRQHYAQHDHAHATSAHRRGT